MTLSVAVVAPLPPARTGPAPYLASLLPALSEQVDLTLCVPEVDAVRPELRERWDVRDLDARHDPRHGLVVYHLANNPWHAEVLDAAMDGPAGLLVLHDASLHHLQVGRTLGAGDEDAYRSLLMSAHGSCGSTVADLATAAPTGPFAFERFLYDCLAPVLDRHLGVQVHSRFAADLVRRRCPGLPVHVVPLRAPSPVAPASRSAWGIPLGRIVLGHAGFVTGPKRYDVMCAAVASLVAEGLDVHLLLAGEDGSQGDLDRVVGELGLVGRVTCTGWQSDDDFDRTIAAFDVALSLRWPHAGESSATLAALLAQGVAVVAEPVGSWAEFPADIVARADLSGGAVEGLLDAVRPFVADSALRQSWSRRAARYAVEHLSTEVCAGALADVFASVAQERLTPVEQRRRALARRDALGPVVPRLRGLPVACPGQRLLVVGAPPEVLAAVPAWGYELCEAPIRRMETGSVDVVCLWGPVDLAEVHRVLAPLGLLHAPELDLEPAPWGLSAVGPGQARKTGPILLRRPLLAG